jgi:tetratricopeptide (TPR) repeat protein
LADALGQKNVDECNGNLYRFRLMMMKGDLEKAAAAAQIMVQSNSQFARSYLCLAQVLQKEGRYDDAIDQYRLALSKQNGNFDAIRGTVECYLALQRPDDAHRYIADGLASNPGDTFFLNEELKWQMQYGDPAKIIPSLQERCNANPDLPDAWRQLADADFRAAQVAMRDAPGHAPQPDAARKLIAAASKDFEGGEKILLKLRALPSLKTQPQPSMLLADYYSNFNRPQLAEASMKDALALSKNAPDVQMKLAAFYTQWRMYDKALQVLDANSTSHVVLQQRIETLFMAHRVEDARKQLEQYLTANPNDAQFQAMLGYAQMSLNHTAQATARLEKAIALDPRNYTAQYYRGVMYLQETNPEPDKAIAHLTIARDLSPAKPEVHVQLAEAYRLKNDMDAAVRELDSTLRRMPRDKDLRMKLLGLYTQSKPERWAEAARCLKEAQTLSPTDPDWFRYEAKMWVLRKDYEQAVDRMHEAINLARTYQKTNIPLLLSLEQQYMDTLSKAKRYDELRKECDSMLQNPQWAQTLWWVYQMRGVARRRTDDRDGAFQDFDKAVDIASKIQDRDATMVVIQTIADSIGLNDAIARVAPRAKTDLHWGLIAAYLYLADNDFPNAVANIEVVLNHASQLSAHDNEMALGVAGTIYILNHNLGKATDVYNSLLRINGNDMFANNNLACVYGEMDDPPRAKDALIFSTRAYDVMMQTGQVSPVVLDTHGWMLCLNGKTDQGLELIQKAVLSDPNLVDGLYHLGEIYLGKSYVPEALTEFNKAQEILIGQHTRNEPVDSTLEGHIKAGIVKAQAMKGPRQAATN